MNIHNASEIERLIGRLNLRVEQANDVRMVVDKVVTTEKRDEYDRGYNNGQVSEQDAGKWP